MKQNLHIKNMVCPRCVSTVQSLFKEQQIPVIDIKLGEVIINKELDDSQKKELESSLKSNGFELLQDHNTQLIEQIKTIIIQQIHFSSENLKVNFSTLLSEQLTHEYTSLSRLFSSVEGITIERFVLKQKIERVKELLFYDESTLSEIAFQMNYSSTAHLSGQFKKETGMTPSEFKKNRNPDLQSLDSL